MNIIGCVPRFIKAHAGWILTGLSILGLTGTAVLVAKETPEVVDIMKEADYDKWKEWDYDICQQVKAICPANNHEKWVKEYERLILQAPYPGLTFAEKFEIAAPRYLPAFLCYLVTAGCMIGAQIFNVKQQAALLAAYGLLAQEFDGYRSEVKDEIGVARERQIFQANRQKMLAIQEENKRLRESFDAQTYMITTLPNVTFDLKPGQLDKALYNFLIKYMDRGGAPLAELYEFIGIPKTVWNERYEGEAEDYGWEDYENEVSWGSVCVDFVVRQIHLKNEKIINLICPTIPPYELGLDYGSKDSSCDNLYRNSHIDYDDIERWLNSIEGQATVFAEPTDNSF